MRSLGGKNFSFKPLKLFYSSYIFNQVWKGLGGPDPPDPPPPHWIHHCMCPDC